MRKIKFKYWDTKLKIMFTRDNLDSIVDEQIKKEDYDEIFDHDELWRPRIELILDFDLSFRDNRFIPLQYTGLDDKNGTEIYEGDILEAVEDWGDTTMKYLYKVIWNLCKCYIDQIKPNNFTLDLLDFVNDEDCFPTTIEVIGNIYENAELLNQ